MQCVVEAGLYMNEKRCKFHKETVKYIGLSISTKVISMDNDEVETNRNWCPET